MNGKPGSADSARRRFLVTLAPVVGWGLSSITPAAAFSLGPQNAESTRDEIRGRLLESVNAERFLAGVGELQLDELACRVATAHAADMARGNFVSHWGSDGRKPYHRYSFAGGIHATQENVASINNFFSADWKDLANDLIFLHVRMHGEKPPRDGHRKAILAPQHTHVGFGFAISERRLRLVETYVAKYLDVVGFQSRARRNESFQLSGRLLNDKHTLEQIDVFYEPLPVLHEPRLPTSGAYGLPDEYETLRPKLREGFRYPDGSSGVIELMRGGKFRAPVTLLKDSAGIYTIVFWVKRQPSENPFAATEICIESG